MLTDGDYIVRMINLPGDINSAVRLSEDGFGNIYINDQLSPKEKRKAFDHEIRHLEREDFWNGLPISEIER